MRTVCLVLAGLVVASGIVSMNLWRDLQSERQLTADLRAQLKEAKAPSRMTTPAAPGASVEVPPVINSGAAPVPRATGTLPPTALPPTAASMRQMQPGNGPRTDPAYRNARLAEMRMRVERTLPGLVEELGLSADDADRLFNVMAESSLDAEAASSLSIDANGRMDPQESMRRQQAARRQQEESLAALLGTARYAQWQQYQKTLIERMEASTLGTQLAQMGQPLSSAQQKSLANALIAERERTRADRERFARSASSATGPQAMAQLEEEAANLQQESDQRLLAAVASSLDARQIDILRRQFAMKLTLDRATSGLQQGR